MGAASEQPGSLGRNGRWARLLAGLSRRAFGLYAGVLFTAVVMIFFATASPLGEIAKKRRVARALTRLFFRMLRMPVVAKGIEQLPSEPHILVINHASFLDAIALTALLPANPGYTFTARQEFRMQSLLCPILQQVHLLVLAHSPHLHSANVDMMSAALRRGESLVIFPEGGFVRARGLRAFHQGPFIVAARTGAKIVIAALRGTRTALPLGTWSMRRVPISLEIGPTFQCSSEEPAVVNAASAAARAAMLALCGEHPSSLRVGPSAA